MKIENIIITGASSGIGAALAIKYAQKKIRLGLIARNSIALERIAQQCRGLGAQVEIGVLDVCDVDRLSEWIKDFDQKYPVDMLIANAGVANTLGNNGEPEAWDAIKMVINTNLYGVLGSVESLIPLMIQRQRGCLVLMSSLAAYRGLPLTPSYCASKAAVKSYGEALRGWLKVYGIQVTVVCPGFVESDMSDRFPAKKPFLMSAQRAADIIHRGVNQRKACIAFPFPLNLGSWLLGIIPSALADIILPWFGYSIRRKL